MPNRWLLGAFALVAACFLAGCPSKKVTTDKAPPASELPANPDVTFESPKKTKYEIRFVAKAEDAPRDEVDSSGDDDGLVAAGTKGKGKGKSKVGPDEYSGTARRVAKISLAKGDVKEYSDLLELLNDLPKDQDMKARNISTDRNSDRVDEEKKNVRVRAWLYAASKEDDNDFHLIVGRDPSKSPKKYMTMELSGLPPAGHADRQQLENARKSFKAFFGSNLPGSRYDFYTPPIPIEVTGSLFFDASHASGSKPGPQSLRPDMPTIWEVHPISSIVFEP